MCIAIQYWKIDYQISLDVDVGGPPADYEDSFSLVSAVLEGGKPKFEW